MGVVTFILGLILLGNTWVLTLSLPVTMGILAIIGGILALFGAFRLRSEQKAAAAAFEAEASRSSMVDIGDEAEEVQAEAAVEAEGDAAAGAAAAGTAAAAAAVAAAKKADEEDAGVDETAADEAAGATRAAGVAAAAAIDETDEEEDSGAAGFPSELEYIEGVGPAYAKQLMEAGINTPAELLEKGATPQGRKEIIDSTGISRKLVLTWINHTDLYRISGVGAEYAELLEAAGVDTVVELSRRNAKNLHKKMVEVNDEKHLVRRTPSQSQVESWVEQAKELPRKVSY